MDVLKAKHKNSRIFEAYFNHEKTIDRCYPTAAGKWAYIDRELNVLVTRHADGSISYEPLYNVVDSDTAPGRKVRCKPYDFSLITRNVVDMVLSPTKTSSKVVAELALVKEKSTFEELLSEKNPYHFSFNVLHKC
jgi:hypothetical protein